MNGEFTFAIRLVGCIEDLHRFIGISAILALEAGDNQTLKFKWPGRESNPGPLAPQPKSLTTRPPPLPHLPLGSQQHALLTSCCTRSMRSIFVLPVKHCSTYNVMKGWITLSRFCLSIKYWQ